MRKIWGFLKVHFIVDFNPFYYGFIAVFLTASIYYNYKVDFEDSFLDYQEGFTKFFYYFLTNLFAYLIPVFAYAFFSKKQNIFICSGILGKKFVGAGLIKL